MVYNCTAIPEVLDETCGLVVEPGAEYIWDAVTKIKNDNRETCLKRAESFGLNRPTEQYLKTYHANHGSGA